MGHKLNHSHIHNSSAVGRIPSWIESQENRISLSVFAFLYKESRQVSMALPIFMGPSGAFGLTRFPPARELGALKFMILLEIWKIEVGI
ncbi:MAG: hypothetical protein JRD89_18370 [Deltaproteobacteria bacterium]|nr:hypothetical protein [Deltaproteobacteria bacterium]